MQRLKPELDLDEEQLNEIFYSWDTTRVFALIIE